MDGRLPSLFYYESVAVCPSMHVPYAAQSSSRGKNGPKSVAGGPQQLVAQLDAFPESRAALLKRVRDTVHGGGRSPLGHYATILETLLLQQQQQQRGTNHNPNHYYGKGSWTESPLLCSPMLCVTHADVVEAAVTTCAPRYQPPFDSGVSVPYCSLTQLQSKHNKFRRRQGSHM